MTSQESMFSSDATTNLSQHKWVMANREANARKVKETKVNKTVTGCRVAIEGPCATNLYCTLATHPFQALNARMEQKAKEDKVTHNLARSSPSILSLIYAWRVLYRLQKRTVGRPSKDAGASEFGR